MIDHYKFNGLIPPGLDGQRKETDPRGRLWCEVRGKSRCSTCDNLPWKVGESPFPKTLRRSGGWHSSLGDRGAHAYTDVSTSVPVPCSRALTVERCRWQAAAMVCSHLLEVCEWLVDSAPFLRLGCEQKPLGPGALSTDLLSPHLPFLATAFCLLHSWLAKQGRASGWCWLNPSHPALGVDLAPRTPEPYSLQ